MGASLATIPDLHAQNTNGIKSGFGRRGLGGSPRVVVLVRDAAVRRCMHGGQLPGVFPSASWRWSLETFNNQGSGMRYFFPFENPYGALYLRRS
ncbi:hypothetical protein CSIM01_02080 [Colletotrichum simmondsii]|uniref:Uncharacterized protein n=1 Tax=Colletotrichum simmondsii TaxID=703756 RepID=A0A135RZC2_9PEZI|nr:hypothetical protein CSIM01_02080 [Colletotrichum simmondsii]